jgi:hypothetical protein
MYSDFKTYTININKAQETTLDVKAATRLILQFNPRYTAAWTSWATAQVSIKRSISGNVNDAIALDPAATVTAAVAAAGFIVLNVADIAFIHLIPSTLEGTDAEVVVSVLMTDYGA